MSPDESMVLLESCYDRLDFRHEFGALTTTEILRGHPDTGLVVVVASAGGRPVKADLQAAFAKRAKGHADPVLVCAAYPSGSTMSFALFGPSKDSVPVYGLERGATERLLEDAIAMESPTRLSQELGRRLGALGSGRPGLRNEGLFALHTLDQQPQRSDWSERCDEATRVLGSRSEALLGGLGYALEQVADGVVLKDSSDGYRRAAAVLLSENESLDSPLGRFQGSTAISHGLALARREGVPWLIVLGGPTIRLFPADPDVGVARKGQTQTFLELDLSLLGESTAGFLTLLFSAGALAPNGTVDELLAESSKYATDLSSRLRDRIYIDVIPTLAVSVAAHLDVGAASPEDERQVLDDAYHQTMLILFRLLFVAYAEDRGLLPLDTNDAYASNALNTLAKRILDNPDEGFSTTSTSMWSDLTQIWDVIHDGDLEGMGVPAYGGALFTRDANINALGANTYSLRLTNDEIGPVIRGLMIDTTPDGVDGLVDFRSLDVREFGTIYEGLLESGLDMAPSDLTVDKDDNYVPAKKDDEVLIDEGDVYLHSRSGSRKASGSYFTKPFAVQHLLDQALEPALNDHLARVAALVESGATTTAAEHFFDFRVADLAMGSAHFLVAAIDRIEARFSEFLARHPLPGVIKELEQLRESAIAQLGQQPETASIDNSLLLRRQIARRCIYGIDVNDIAVQLARLAIWIHTFVPGLPLSFLNHGLVRGNSLTGVATIDEITKAVEEAQEREDKEYQGAGLLDLHTPLRDLLDRAGTHLAELAQLSGVSITEVNHVAQLRSEIEKSLEPMKALCDLITAERTTRKMKKADPDKILLVGGGDITSAMTAPELEAAILSHPDLKRAQAIARQVHAAHLPTLYPEVFRRSAAGFDVVLGNPPWEKLHVEEHNWWATRFPGLRSLKQSDQIPAIAKLKNDHAHLLNAYGADVDAQRATAAIIAAGPYPGIGEAHLDLFAAFSWRFWDTVRDNGRVGVVLPRTAMSGSATAQWRKDVLADGTFRDITMLTNTARWAFDMEPRYTIALVTLTKNRSEESICLRGPYSSHSEYQVGVKSPGASLPKQEVMQWSDSVSIPLVPESNIDIFRIMKRHPRLDDPRDFVEVRPVQGDMNATKEKALFNFDLSAPQSSESLPVWTGSTFNLWEPGSGDPYAYANPNDVVGFLQEKRLRQVGLKSSAFYGQTQEWAADPSTLPMNQPRIAFRDVCRATDSRTMICALVPPGVALVHKAPFLFQAQPDHQASAYLLGILSSRIFDWFARHFIEISMTFELLNSFPVPRLDGDSGHAVVATKGIQIERRDLRDARSRLIDRSGRLAAVDDRYAVWAGEVGVPVGSLGDSSSREDAIAEIDALVAYLYGLSRSQLGHVFATFHRGWAYEEPLAATLEHYDRWAMQPGGDDA